MAQVHTKLATSSLLDVDEHSVLIAEFPSVSGAGLVASSGSVKAKAAEGLLSALSASAARSLSWASAAADWYANGWGCCENGAATTSLASFLPPPAASSGSSLVPMKVSENAAGATE
eukprot:CAMPEP_0178397568 /NCGR_PEP_ID=MMETSP0689_2-20121128/14316_1 /TAXON_ID=160604 /ORGANISM="Amphidinium massartii, Strain CS-259" /LENGTH=116 /DNA_ID=CAMNT_0020018287 /DNA_START=230 /DNA_END=581 /DNA_ORIENTATION=-